MRVKKGALSPPSLRESPRPARKQDYFPIEETKLITGEVPDPTRKQDYFPIEETRLHGYSEN